MGYTQTDAHVDQLTHRPRRRRRDQIELPSDSRCYFCHVGTGTFSSGDLPVWDCPIAATRNFFVVPSLGSTVEGWLLVVPKCHALSTSELSVTLLGELDGLVSLLHAILERLWGRTVLFEHGAGSNHSPLGCGVNHAHLHLVPTAVKLREAAEEAMAASSGKGACVEVDRLCELNGTVRCGAEYLFFREDDCHGVILYPRRAASQFFRRAIALEAGCPERFDYRKYPLVHNAIATRQRIAFEVPELQRLAERLE